MSKTEIFKISGKQESSFADCESVCRHEIFVKILRNLIYSQIKTEREERNRKLLAEYREQFVTQPHFDIMLEQMRLSFDPRNLVPQDDKGTVYPAIRVTDLWGILTATKRALVASNWKTVTLSAPTEINNRKITGNGWVLELEKGYTLIGENENYKLKKE